MAGRRGGAGRRDAEDHTARLAARTRPPENLLGSQTPVSLPEPAGSLVFGASVDGTDFFHGELDSIRLMEGAPGPSKRLHFPPLAWRPAD